MVWQMLSSLGLTRGDFRGWADEPASLGTTDAELLGRPTVFETFLATARSDRAAFALLLSVARVRVDDSVVYVHGFQNDDRDAAANVNPTRAALRRNGYDGPVVGFSWDSNTGAMDFGDANYRAVLNGAKLGSFLLDHACHCPETKLRLVSHSLGAAVDEIALGDERYRDAIRDEVGTLWNYYNHEDDVLSATYWAGGGDDALGEAGRQRDYSWSPFSHGDDPTPDNVRERDVSGEVGNDYSGYNDPTNDYDAHDPEGDGVIDDVYADWSR